MGCAWCVVEELDIGGSGLGQADALALVSSCRTLKTLTLGEWAMPLEAMRSGAAVSSEGKAVGDVE
eukprot:1773753-Prymnesium_polylepis.1